MKFPLRIDRATVGAWIGAALLALGWSLTFTQPQSLVRVSDREGSVAGVTDPVEPAGREVLLSLHPPKISKEVYPVSVAGHATLADVFMAVERRYGVPFTLTTLAGTPDAYLTSAAGRDSTVAETWVIYHNGERLGFPPATRAVRAGDAVDLFWERNFAYTQP